MMGTPKNRIVIREWYLAWGHQLGAFFAIFIPAIVLEVASSLHIEISNTLLVRLVAGILLLALNDVLRKFISIRHHQDK